MATKLGTSGCVIVALKHSTTARKHVNVGLDGRGSPRDESPVLSLRRGCMEMVRSFKRGVEAACRLRVTFYCKR
jgi:hypothetical protein